MLCDVSQQEVLEEEMSICRLLGPKAMDCEVVAAVAFQDFKLACNPLVFRYFSGLFFLFCVKLRLKAMMCGHETLKPLPVSLRVCQPNVAPKWPRLLCIRLSYLRRKYVLSKSTMNIIIPDQTHRFVLLISIM